MRALFLILSLAAVVLLVSPTVVMMSGRNSNIGPNPAFDGLGLPLQRKLIFTDTPFPPWVALVKPDGTITVLRRIRQDWPTAKYQHVVTHEYGHALLDDVIADGRYLSLSRERLYERISATRQEGQLPKGTPQDLTIVFEAYQRTQPDAYESDYWRGDMATHLTDYFGEFFAESFARWRTGQQIDPAVADALARLTEQGAEEPTERDADSAEQDR